MKIGKVPNSILENLIKDIKTRDEVLVGSKIGRDTAILDFNDRLLVLSTDPITGASKGIGSLAINVSVNDLATEGAEPIAVILTILAPPGTSADQLKTIMDDAKLAAEKVNVAIVGGHTEITDAVNRVIMSSTVLGALEKPYIKADVEPGDLVVVTKTLGIEGTSIISKEKFEEIKDLLSEEEIQEAHSYEERTSVVNEGLIAKKYGAKYMHDITEGGLLGAIWEAAKANNVGIKVQNKNLPISKLTEKISDHFNIDSRKLISSGSMLIIVSEENFINLKAAYDEENLMATVIGEVSEGFDVELVENGQITLVDEPGSDEIYSVL